MMEAKETTTTDQTIIGSLIMRALANETPDELAHELIKALAALSFYFNTQEESDEFLQVTHQGIDNMVAEMKKADAYTTFTHNETVQ
jgi:hypothetical protein